LTDLACDVKAVVNCLGESVSAPSHFGCRSAAG